MALSKSQRLTGRGVQRVFARARIATGQHLTMRVAHGEGGERKFAVLVPMRIAARATERNRIRRRITEALRPLMTRVQAGVHVTVIARTVQPESGQELRENLLALMKKSGIVNT